MMSEDKRDTVMSEDTKMTDLDALEALAKAALPTFGGPGGLNVFDIRPGYMNSCDEFVHAANPKTVLALTAKVRTLEEALRVTAHRVHDALEHLGTVESTEHGVEAADVVLREAYAGVRQALGPVCGTCGGLGAVEERIGDRSGTVPCPDCKEETEEKNFPCPINGTECQG